MDLRKSGVCLGILLTLLFTGCGSGGGGGQVASGGTGTSGTTGATTTTGTTGGTTAGTTAGTTTGGTTAGTTGGTTGGTTTGTTGGTTTGGTTGSPGLNELNALRSLANLPAVTENAQFSADNALHCQWIILNNQLAHQETPGSPGFTTAGNIAGTTANLSATTGTFTIAQAIDGLMTAPFHGIGFIDPRLVESGFGLVTNNTVPQGNIRTSAAATITRNLPVNVPVGTTFPIRWPDNGKTVPFTSFSGNEFPDPLTSAPGAQGMPIYLQLGSDPAGTNPVTVSAFSLTRVGFGVVPAFEFDESNYVNPDANTQALGRLILNTRDAIVIMPRDPLVKGAQYTVSVTANGQVITWSFMVSATAAPRQLQGDPARYN